MKPAAKRASSSSDIEIDISIEEGKDEPQKEPSMKHQEPSKMANQSLEKLLEPFSNMPLPLMPQNESSHEESLPSCFARTRALNPPETEFESKPPNLRDMLGLQQAR